MSIVVVALIFGVITAAILAIGAVGFSIQFAIAGIFNLAYGDVMIAAAYIAYLFNARGLAMWACAVIGILAGAGISVLLHRLLYKPLMARGTSFFGMVIVTLGTGLVIQNLILVIGGPTYFSYSVSTSGALRIGPTSITGPQVITVLVAVVTLFALHILLNQTKLGKALRATASNAALAKSSGVRTARITDLAWVISGSFCGLAGVVLGVALGSFQASTGDSFLILMVAAAIMGGVGRPYGSMIGAVVVALASQLSAVVIDPAYKNVTAFVILILIILIRPQGLMPGTYVVPTEAHV